MDGSQIEKVDCFYFLGRTISETLSWKPHIDKIGKKISKVIGMMCRIKTLVKCSILHKIYNTLIVSHLHYGILCWGFSCKKLFKLQKKAIRIICNGTYNSHTDPFFKRLKLLKIDDIFKLQCLTFFFKYEKKTVPGYFISSFKFMRNSELHNHNTRISDQYRSANVNRQTTKKTLHHHIPNILNETSQDILNKIYTHSLENFKSRIKISYIDKYQSQCQKLHRYVCSR